MDKRIDFESLTGAKLLGLFKFPGGGLRHDGVVISTDRGPVLMAGEIDCCNYISLADVSGVSAHAFLGETIIEASERTEDHDGEDDEACLWTFYYIKTNSLDICLRFVGSSNGYYSVSVETEEYDGSLDGLKPLKDT